MKNCRLNERKRRLVEISLEKCQPWIGWARVRIRSHHIYMCHFLFKRAKFAIHLCKDPVKCTDVESDSTAYMRAREREIKSKETNEISAKHRGGMGALHTHTHTVAHSSIKCNPIHFLSHASTRSFSIFPLLSFSASHFYLIFFCWCAASFPFGIVWLCRLLFNNLCQVISFLENHFENVACWFDMCVCERAQAFKLNDANNKTISHPSTARALSILCRGFDDSFFFIWFRGTS